MPQIAPDDQLSRLQRSVRKRDRRIAHLKKLLAASRAATAEKRGIIDGLERALLMHRPTVDDSARQRIAELETQLADLAALVDVLDDTAPIQGTVS